MSFREACIESRKRLKMSQEAAARAIGISLRGYQNWESGAEPSLSKALKAARVFGWTPEALQQMGWSINPGPDLQVVGAA